MACDFDTLRPFRLPQDDRYLFHDIFALGDRVYFIGSPYPDMPQLDHALMTLHCLGKRLSPVKIVDWRPYVLTGFYLLPKNVPSTLPCTVEYRGHFRAFQLPVKEAPSKLCDLGAATLFKDDWPCLESWLRFYVDAHGIDAFFLYYNGRTISNGIHTLLNRYRGDLVVKLIPWHLPHRLELPCVHGNTAKAWYYHAQAVQIAHSLCKYGSLVEMLLLVDLDEYVVFPSRHQRLVDFVRSNNSADVIRLECRWASCHDANTDHFVFPGPDVFNHRIRAKAGTEGALNRTKCIVKPHKIEVQGVHHPRLPSDCSIQHLDPSTAFFLHFFHFTSPSRRIEGVDQEFKVIHRGDVSPGPDEAG